MLLVGVLKEIMDMRLGKNDMLMDLAFDLAGVGLAALLIIFL